MRTSVFPTLLDPGPRKTGPALHHHHKRCQGPVARVTFIDTLDSSRHAAAERARSSIAPVSFRIDRRPPPTVRSRSPVGSVDRRRHRTVGVPWFQHGARGAFLLPSLVSRDGIASIAGARHRRCQRGPARRRSAPPRRVGPSSSRNPRAGSRRAGSRSSPLSPPSRRAHASALTAAEPGLRQLTSVPSIVIGASSSRRRMGPWDGGRTRRRASSARRDAERARPRSDPWSGAAGPGGPPSCRRTRRRPGRGPVSNATTTPTAARRRTRAGSGR